MSEDNGGAQIGLGLLLLAVGILLTVGTYSAAKGGGTYVLAWGPMVYGAITLVRGLMKVGR